MDGISEAPSTPFANYGEVGVEDEEVEKRDSSIFNNSTEISASEQYGSATEDIREATEKSIKKKKWEEREREKQAAMDAKRQRIFIKISSTFHS